ncbi:phosphatase with homology to tensin [Anaeramoeba flamelloides]|uniref:Phosphatidylinositol 3,4,5-trisphosphate 3-phosphatase and dual-specificity protein phosphatase PTEN n=1 Tax=Anaeramoeba flamelloides TaxID=1746091 RepID=A0ABQ8ZD57_9EUKA|nr:phosphatase with homology to tensin [Anaeramoeba flamelloides]
MTTGVRKLVSKKKKRLKIDGFNLDLSYITPQIVTMGFPASKLEGMYRNKMTDVVKYFDLKHKDKYFVYNLCSEKDYDHSNFYERVQKFPFEDHNPPPIELMMIFCKHAANWLSQGKGYLVVVHCKAGKGRSGVMACCLMIYLGVVSTAKESLDFYGNQRTKNGKGVTIPSQRRYVGYFEKIFKNGLKPIYVAELKKITMGPLKKIEFSIKTDKKSPRVEIYNINWRKIFSSETSPVVFSVDSSNNLSIKFKEPFFCSGDVRIAFYNQNEHLFNLWFNSAYLESTKFSTNKYGLDILIKNKSIKKFDAKLYFDKVRESNSNDVLFHDLLSKNNNNNQSNNKLIKKKDKLQNRIKGLTKKSTKNEKSNKTNKNDEGWEVISNKSKSSDNGNNQKKVDEKKKESKKIKENQKINSSDNVPEKNLNKNNNSNDSVDNDNVNDNDKKKPLTNNENEQIKESKQINGSKDENNEFDHNKINKEFDDLFSQLEIEEQQTNNQTKPKKISSLSPKMKKHETTNSSSPQKAKRTNLNPILNRKIDLKKTRRIESPILKRNSRSSNKIKEEEK